MMRNYKIKNNEFSACVSNFGFINSEDECPARKNERDSIMKSGSPRSRVIGRAHDNLSEGEKMDEALELGSLKSRR